MITVSAHSYDDRAYGLKKAHAGIIETPREAPKRAPAHPRRTIGFSPEWYSWRVDTAPDVSQLSPLAAWLVENLPRCVAELMPSSEYNVYCYDGRTQADVQRALVGGELAELQIRGYGLADQPARFDWLFSQISPKQSFEVYWNEEADRMMKVGVKKIQIRRRGLPDAVWNAPLTRGTPAAQSDNRFIPTAVGNAAYSNG